jgi:hypothetical protein
MKRMMMRLAVGVIATVLVATGLVSGGPPVAQATNNPYVLVTSDIACDATAKQDTGGVNPQVQHCQQGLVAASFDPNTPSTYGGAGFFTTGVYGSFPKRIVIPGDVQYTDGWSDAYGCGSTRTGTQYGSGAELPSGDTNYCNAAHDGSTTHWVPSNCATGTYNTCLPASNATYCPGADGGASVWGDVDPNGLGGSCSFAKTFPVAARNDTVPGPGDGIIAGAGSHDWNDAKQETGESNPDCSSTSNPCPSGSRPSWCSSYMQGGGTLSQACGWYNEFPVNTWAGSNGVCNQTSVSFGGSNYACPDQYGDYTEEVSGGTSGKLNVITVDDAACMTDLGAALCQNNGAITNWVRAYLGDSTANPPGDTTIINLYNPLFSDFDHGDYFTNTVNGSNGTFNRPFKELWHAFFPTAEGTQGFTPCGTCSTYGQQPDVIVGGHNHGYERIAPVGYVASNGVVSGGTDGIPIVSVATGGQDVSTNTAPNDCTGGTCTPCSTWCSVFGTSSQAQTDYQSSGGYDYWASGGYGTTPNVGTNKFGILQLSYTTGANPTWSATYDIFGSLSAGQSCVSGGVNTSATTVGGTPQNPCQIDSVSGTSNT